MQKLAWLVMSLVLTAPPAMAAEVGIQYIFAMPARTPGQLEPLASKAGGKYLRAPVQGDDDTVNRYLKVLAKGASYPVYVGGAPKGKVTVKSVDKELVIAKGAIDFQQTDNAIATTIKAGKHAPPMPLTQAQKAQAALAALQKFKSEHVVIPPANKITSKFYGRDLNGDGKPEIIAEWFIPAGGANKDAANSVLLFGTFKDNGKLQVERIHCEHVYPKDLLDGATLKDVQAGFLTNSFFDNFDLDGDGWDEIITSKDSFEGTWYYIWYRKPKGSWYEDYNAYRYRQAF